MEETRKEIIDVQNEKTTFMVREIYIACIVCIIDESVFISCINHCVLLRQEKYNVKLEEDKLKEYLEEVDSYQQKHLAAVSDRYIYVMYSSPLH